ncbi:efflux RND transporter permease subunit [Serratia ureilytica]
MNEARVIASSPPAITGLGNSSGFDMELEDHAGLGHAKLMAARDQLLQLAAQSAAVARAPQRPGRQPAAADRYRSAQGAGAGRIYRRHQQYPLHRLGFDLRQRLRRSRPGEESLRAGRRTVPHAAGRHQQMVCAQQRGRHGAVLGLRQFTLEYGSPRLERYNGNSALEIVGEAANGVSTGTAMAEMEKLVSQLPTGFGLEWTALSYRERCPAAGAGAVRHLAAGCSSAAAL